MNNELEDCRSDLKAWRDKYFDLARAMRLLIAEPDSIEQVRECVSFLVDHAPDLLTGDYRLVNDCLKSNDRLSAYVVRQPSSEESTE